MPKVVVQILESIGPFIALTARVDTPRAVGGVALLALSILLMWTQTTNPFLYFQF